MNFLKTTVIGGLVFLVPVAVLILVLGKVFGVMVAIAEPMAHKIPIDSIGGIAIANVIAVMIILLICFAAGLVARTQPAQKFANSIENAVLQKIPGYSLIRGNDDQPDAGQNSAYARGAGVAGLYQPYRS